MQLLALAQSQQHFGSSFLEIDFERHQRQTLFAGPGREPLDLALVHQDLARPAGLVVELVRPLVLGDVAAQQPHFVAADARIGLLQRNLAAAQAFDLAPDENNSALQRLEDLVLEARAAVLGDEPVVIALAVGGLLGGFGAFCSVLCRELAP